MSVITKDLGAVTAYAAAVNRGYTGTREEFETLMASYAYVGEQAAESASNASQSATNALQSATNAETAKGVAQQAATDAETAQASAQGYAQSAQQSAQSASQSATDAESAKNTAVSTVDRFDSHAQQALDSVNLAGINWESLAEAQKLDSEAWAVGQRDGEDVGSSDPAYHNNAKWYVQQGGSSAQTASEAAQTATTKAGEAQASAEAAAESARTLTIDDTLTQAGQAADSKAVRNAVEGVREGLNQIYSDQIVGMEETGEASISPNLFKYAELIGERKSIYSISNGKVTLSDNAAYNTYLIPVDGESTYTFTNCRSAVLVSDKNLTAIGQIKTYITSVQSADAKYIVFSFSPTDYPVSTYSITKPVSNYYIPNNWNISKASIDTAQVDGMLPTGKTVESSNLFPKATLVASGKYVDRISDGKAVLSNNASYDTYIIPVDGESAYTFTNCRMAVLVSDLSYTAVSGLLSNVTQIDSTGGLFILWSFNPTTYPVAGYKVTKPVAEYTIPNNWNLEKGTKTGYHR